MSVQINRLLMISLVLASFLMLIPLHANVGDALVEDDQVLNTGDFTEGEILVGFRPGASAKGIGQIRKKLQASSKKDFPQIRVRHWKLPKGLSVEKAISILMKNPSVEFAEPNYIYSADIHPDDAHVGELWGMHNVGQTGGVPDADIDAAEAWDVRTDASEIVVGIIDTGIDPLHEDLADNIWYNLGEIDGDVGVDDDGNGYVDDIWGWDFVNDDNEPFDDKGHGTHVAGTIGGIGNNGKGVAGVVWSVKLMALKFLDSSGRGETDDAIEAVLYAASMGVPITNNSWGGGKKSVSLQNAIAASNSLFVASAGNRNTSKTQYPAGYSLNNILSVAASDANDEKASFSNYSNRWVDLAAPGVDILSSLPGNAYDYFSGTSMAAPHVTGVAAMVMAQYPGLLPTEVKAYILDSVDPLPAFDGITVSGGRLNANTAVGGGGQTEVDTIAPAAVIDMAYIPGSATYDSLELQWTASADDGNDPTSGTAFHYDLRYMTDEEVTEINWDIAMSVDGEPTPQLRGATESMLVTGLAAGMRFHFALKVIDEAGNTSGLSNGAFGDTLISLWFTGVVDDVGRVGFYQSLALDPDEYPAIAYSDGTNGNVKFAQWDGGEWNRVVVGSGGPGVSLAFDPDGNPAISHGWGKLYFAQRNGTNWTTEVVERKGAYNDVTSLAYDPSGNPCVAYQASSRKIFGLKLACNYGFGWEIQYVENDVSAKYKSLAFNSSGNPLIAYSDNLDGDSLIDTLKLAQWNGSSWDVEIISTGQAGIGVFASLVIDPVTEKPMIVDRANNKVRFHHRVGDHWEMVEVDEGSETSLAIDSTGNPYISYSTSSPAMVKVAHPVSAGLYDNWDIQTVDNTNWWRTSISVKSSSGLPIIGYGDTATDILKWAERLDP
jgi:subtilisin family serine protease